MGNTWSEETNESWHNEDVKEWKERSIELQKQYYNGYEGAQFHSIDCSEEGNQQLLQAKVCYAFFGMPTEEKATNLLDGYTIDQQKDAAAFTEKIYELYALKHQANVEIMVLFICCKTSEHEYTLPVFRLRLEDASIKYIDTSKRVYNNWQDWLDNNNLPMMKYCYPKFGYYSCSFADRVEYRENTYPALEVGNSPACNFSARVAKTLDVTSTVTSLGSAGIMIAGMFTPLAPVVLVTGGIAGFSSAAWGTSRSVQRLLDKKQHGECLSDIESVTSWLAIAMLPLAFATSVVNANLANGARNGGRIFTSTIRTAATILNCTNLGLQSGMLVLGLANLVEKKKNNQLTALDVLQFSMTVFFFTNTMMQPKTATGIIAKAQTEQVQQYRDSMTDETARSTFDRYLKQNKGDEGIKAMSKIVRSLNKIKDPDQLFNGLANADNIKIGGRKGNTLLVSNEGTEAMPTRMSVNRTMTTSRPATMFRTLTPHQRRQMNDALRGHADTPFGKRILNIEKMQPHEVSRLNNVLKSTCRNYDTRIVDVAVTLAADLDVKNVGDFCAVLELVSQQGGSAANLDGRLAYITGPGKAEFLTSIQNDTARAREIASGAGMVFDSDLKAAYHYRKHGVEFVLKGDPMDYYLRVLPEKHFTTSNLRKVDTHGDMIIETYCTPNGDFGVLAKRPGCDKPIVATLFKNDKYLETFKSHLAENMGKNNFRAPTTGFMSEMLSNLSGGADPTGFLRFFHIQQ